jgi:hypothetical protein
MKCKYKYTTEKEPNYRKAITATLENLFKVNNKKFQNPFKTSKGF